MSTWHWSNLTRALLASGMLWGLILGTTMLGKFGNFRIKVTLNSLHLHSTLACITEGLKAYPRAVGKKEVSSLLFYNLRTLKLWYMNQRLSREQHCLFLSFIACHEMWALTQVWARADILPPREVWDGCLSLWRWSEGALLFPQLQGVLKHSPHTNLMQGVFHLSAMKSTPLTHKDV